MENKILINNKKSRFLMLRARIFVALATVLGTSFYLWYNFHVTPPVGPCVACGMG